MFHLKENFIIMKEDKKFLRKALMIGLPIALQGLLNTLLNLVDTVMIGRLGESTIAAVGLANKVFFVFTLLLFGIVSGAGILTAQYWGKRDIKNIRCVLGMSLLLGVAASFLFLVPALLCPELIMRIFTPSEKAIEIGAAYLTIVAISYPLTAVTNAYISLLRGINQVKAPVVITIIAICVNVFFNYTLIFGHFGAPAMGVRGAALATLIARIVECVSLVTLVYLRKSPAAAKLKELIAFKKEFVKTFFSNVAPVVANEFMWGLGVTIYALVYGRMGDAAMAAITITQTVEQIFMVIFQGIGAATTVILGNELGANNLKRADQYARNFMILQFGLGIVVVFLSLVMRGPIIQLFHVSDEVAVYIRNCLLVFALYAPVKMFNFINIVGVLRSGGDTKAALLLDTTGVWFIGIPLAFLGGMVLKAPIYIVYAMVLVEEIYKMALGIPRYRKKKWLRNLVDEIGKA